MDISDGIVSPMQMSQMMKGGLLGVMVVSLTVFSANAYYQTRPRQVIAHLLRLEQVPASLGNAHCESWGVNDVLSTCTFEVDPAEFESLLIGWQFNESAASGGSHSYSGGPKVGREFQVAAEYAVTPDEFEHGGRVSVVANRDRSLVQLNYYKE